MTTKEPPTFAQRHRKAIIFGSVIFVVITLAVVIPIYALVIQPNQRRNVGKVTYDIPNNPNLHKSFYGLAYTPNNAQYPDCGVHYKDIVDDLKVLSQLTSRIRLYGMDCRQADYVLDAVKELKVDMKVALTLWIDAYEETYERQYKTFLGIVDKHGLDRVDLVLVGNEVLYRKETTFEKVVEKIKQMKKKLKELGYEDIVVSTSDLGDNYNDQVIEAVDVAMANIHPYFAGDDVGKSAAWSFAYFDNNIGDKSKKAGKDAIMSEVGWPTGPQDEKVNASVPSIPNLQEFTDDFVCEANKQGYKYYYFEAFDAPWKIRYSELETQWGIMTVDRELKINIPNCPI